jgi:hypothetical protein
MTSSKVRCVYLVKFVVGGAVTAVPPRKRVANTVEALGDSEYLPCSPTCKSTLESTLSTLESTLSTLESTLKSTLACWSTLESTSEVAAQPREHRGYSDAMGKHEEALVHMQKRS